MSTRADFTFQEWQLLIKATEMVGLALKVAEKRVFSEILKEAFAEATGLKKGGDHYNSTELMKAFFANDEELEKDASFKLAEENQREQARTTAFDTLRQVAALLDSKATPQEADEFKQFLMFLGQHIANAHKEGTIFGMGNKSRVSEAEAATLQEMSAALGV